MSSTPAKTKKVAKATKPAAHPKYVDMVKQAISVLKDRRGSSRQAIVKYITANFKVEKNASFNVHLKMAITKGVESGALKRVKGVGAAGSFKLGGEEKVKKPKAKKPKAAKKATGEKKPKAKKPKTPKKKAAAKPKKSPAKKAAKPKKSPAKKAAKKVKSPKKSAAKKAAKK